MMPNMYAKDSYGSSFPNLHQYGVPLSAIARMTYPSELEQSRTQSDSPKFKDGTQNPNTDSIMLVQKRKMLRRAANRRSAQLSRARKKVKYSHFYCLPIFYV